MLRASALLILAACHADAISGSPVERAPALAPDDGFGAPVAHPERISSTFGPRWKWSESRYDFHLGIDYFGELGEPVMAIGPGQVNGTYPDGSPQFPSGGNAVVITHDLPPGRTFHGRPVTRVHAVYLHLDTIEVAEGEMVSSGQVVGAMGMSGDTDFVHLHFETRVESPCSLPFQLMNPDAACAIGFDPHVHPFLFVGGENADRISVEEVDAPSGFVLRYRATRGDLDLDVIETDLGTIGFGERAGIDATSVAALDDFDYGFLRIVPAEFRSASEELVIDLQFPVRPAYVELRDIYGRGWRYSP